MIAETAKVENKCAKCGSNKTTPHELKKYGQICETCYLEVTQKDLPLDEYDLRPDELTKEQFADKAGVTLRAVEGWKKDGKIAADKLRRRVNGVVRKQLIFKVADVEKFLNNQNEPVKLPTVENTAIEKTKTSEQNEFHNASQMFIAENLGKFADSMNNFARQLPSAESNIKPFLNIKEASDTYGLAQAEIKRLIDSEELKSFKGSHGEILVSRKQIENL